MHRCQLFCHIQGIYLNEYMQVAKHKLSWRRFLQYRNMSIDLFCKPMDLFLYDSDLHHERFKMLFIHIHQESVLTCCNTFFFSTWLFFREYLRFTRQQVKGKAISLYPFYHFQLLYRHLDISWVVTAESSPLRIADSRNRTWNLWYTFFRIHSFYTCTGSCSC